MKFKRILVSVSGSMADEEAVRLACRLARKDRAEVLAVYVIPIERTLPLDTEIGGEVEKAEAVLERIEKVAGEEACAVETDLLQARDTAPAIVDEAVERQADLILMGVVYQKRFGQFSLGETVPHVLKNAPCRVILYQHYPS